MAGDLAKPTSFRLEQEIITELRKVADERGETLSDTLRRGALLVLGYCPTCQRKVEPEASHSTGLQAHGGC